MDGRSATGPVLPRSSWEQAWRPWSPASPGSHGFSLPPPSSSLSSSCAVSGFVGRRLLALGGVVGPATFVTAWVVGSARLSDYSLVEGPISRLAARGASTRLLMTTGFVVFGVAVPLFAVPLRRWVRGRSWMTAVGTGLATLGVAATPLNAGLDTLHGVFAGVGYITLAATPLVAVGPLARSGRRGWCRFSVGAGLASAGGLAATALGPASGLCQRIGLTIGHAWLATAALDMLRRPANQSSPHEGVDLTGEGVATRGDGRGAAL